MCKKLAFLVCVIVVLGLVGSASGVAYTWNWTAGDDSWCNSSNWAPSGVPGVTGPGVDEATISAGDGPTIPSGCEPDVFKISGPDPGTGSATMDITGGKLTVQDNWGLDRGSTGTRTINISGDSVVKVLGTGFVRMGPDHGTGILNISGDPNISIGGGVTGGDAADGELIVSISGGRFYAEGGLYFGNDGGGELTVSGSDTVVDVQTLYFGCRAEGSEMTFTMSGGTVNVRGLMDVADSQNGDHTSPYAIQMFLDAGTLVCGNWHLEETPTYPDGIPFRMDINDGIFKVKGQEYVDEMEGYIDKGWIVSYGGASEPDVVWDGEYTVVGNDVAQEKAYKPWPNLTTGICPDVTLTWSPGIYCVADHNVYFGSDLSDVNESATVYLENHPANSVTVTGLQLDTWHYWRIDEVNDACDASPWTGSIWSFKTQNGKASDPSPEDGRRGVPPDWLLSWTPCCVATGQKLYLGTYLPERIVLLEDDFEDGFDPSWAVTTGWAPYNATGDSNFAPHDHNLAKATGSATLESGALDARFANAVDVSIYVRRTEDITADELNLYYYDGSTYDPVSDFNVVALGPNDTWLHFTDTITDNQYFTNNFGIKLVASITGGTVYVDDVTVTNTWPVDPNWLEANNLSGTDTNYAPALNRFERYYWRVDTNTPEGWIQGDVWEFATGAGGLIMYYKFNGTVGNPLPSPIAADESYPGGSIEFKKYTGAGGSVTYGQSNPVIAVSTASADFDPCSGLYRENPAAEGEFDPLGLAGWQYTIEMWVKPQSLGGEQTLINKRVTQGSNHRYRISINDNDFEWGHDGEEVEMDGAVAGEWAHVAAVYDLTEDTDKMRFYLNGVLGVSRDEPGLNQEYDSNDVTIGMRETDAGDYTDFFDGLIDEIRIYDVALNPCEFLLLPGPEWPSCPTPYDGESEVDPCGVVLSWSPGSLATSHKVYFGTDFDDVNTLDPSAKIYEGPDTSVPLPDLENGTNYHWRVVELNGGGPWEGRTWRFTTTYVIEDPTLILHYKFDETSGDDTFDASGHGHHGDVDGPEGNWDPTGGKFDGCRIFDDDTHVDPPLEVTTYLSNAVSISVWLNGLVGQDQDEDMVVLDWSSGSGASYAMRIVVPDDSGDVVWRAGNDSCDVLLWDTAPARQWTGDWHHLVFIKDESAGTMKIYFDAELVKEKEGAISSLSNIGLRPFRIGAYIWSSNDYEGRMDDLRLYKKAIPKSKVEELFRGGELGIAWKPSPYDAQPDAHPAADLSWESGNWASSHEVYFGTNKQRVTDANNDANYWPDVYKGKQDPCTYDPGPLDLTVTYYWRIDEVNDANNDRWTGNIWRFRVADYLVIDNFDDDTAQDPPTYDWYNGTAIGTGAQISLRSTPPIIGEHSMRYGYANNFDWGAWHYYSETQTISLEPNDWDYYDVRVISLWFYGNSGNDATEDETQMNLGLEDDSNYAVVWYGGSGAPEGEEITDVQVEEWQLWEIRTNRFTNINFSDVKKICIGFGTRGWPMAAGGGVVYFDEINLFVPTCMPDLLPLQGDFNRDCRIGWEDVEFMADEWLKSDVYLGAVTVPDPCLLRYEFDETDGNEVPDSSGNNYDGTAKTEDGNSTDALWEPNDGMYDGCIRFEHQEKKYCVAVPNDVFNNITNKITISVWVNWPDPATMPKETNQLFNIHGGPNTVYEGILGIKTTWSKDDEDDEEVRFWDDGNDVVYKPNEADWSGGWNHYAFVKDVSVVPGKLRIYLNGDLVAEGDSNSLMNFPANPAKNAWIGMATDEPTNWHDEYTGLLDDFRIYAFALSQGQVKYIATDGTGFLAVQSIANLYNDEAPGDRAVNLRDFAKLSENWLVRKLWPE